MKFEGEKYKYTPVPRRQRAIAATIVLAPGVAVSIWAIQAPFVNPIPVILVAGITLLPLGLYFGFRKKRQTGMTPEYASYLEQKYAETRERQRAIAYGLSSLVVYVGWLTSALTFGWQALHWLQSGEWKPLPLSLWFEAPQTDWIGLNQVFYFVWDTHVGILALIACIVVAFGLRLE